MAASTELQIAHVLRRLGIGANPHRVADHQDVDSAIAASLAASRHSDMVLDPPSDWEDIEENYPYEGVVAGWIDRLAKQEQPLLERMTWFWHDHFATSNSKVGNTYLMWLQHLTIRGHALGNFRDLLHTIAKDPAMLIYLDGDPSTKDQFNENFAREVMELHTMGRGAHTEEDVKNAARAFTGWRVTWPDEFDDDEGQMPGSPWTATFQREDFDPGSKTIFGVTAAHDLTTTLDLILEQPATGPYVAAQLYRELVGISPSPRTALRIGAAFANSWDIGELVEAIASDQEFLSEAAIGAKVKTPLEKLVTLLQGFEANDEYEPEWVAWMLESQNYQLLAPPNPAGYPAGRRLLSPGQLTSSFGLLNVVAEPEGMDANEIFGRLGMYDVAPRTRWVIDKPWSAGTRLALAFGSPDFAMT